MKNQKKNKTKKQDKKTLQSKTANTKTQRTKKNTHKWIDSVKRIVCIAESRGAETELNKIKSMNKIKRADARFSE